MGFNGRDSARNEDATITRIDHLEGTVSEHIRNELIPRVSEHHRISVLTDAIPFMYYARLQAGRPCSCWNNVEPDPDKGCPVCYGVGLVTGFKKYGCVWHCFDVTYPELTLVGLAPDYDSQTRPIPLVLAGNAPKGWVEWRIEIRPNNGVLDALRLLAHGGKGQGVTLMVRRATETDFTTVTSVADVQSRLNKANGRPETLVFRVELRKTRTSASPRFTGLHLRYRTRDDITLNVDIPRDNKSITMTEMGFTEQWETIQLIFGDKVRTLSAEDFLIRMRDNSRWKLLQVSPFIPMQHYVGADGTARLVQSYENYAKVL